MFDEERDFVANALVSGLSDLLFLHGSCPGPASLPTIIPFMPFKSIYHVPGGALYAKMRIDTAKGERWFCSEAEAWAAGWQRAKR